MAEKSSPARREVRGLLRDHSVPELHFDEALASLVRVNPAWRQDIVAAVEEVVGDPIYRWSDALGVLARQGCLQIEGLPDSWLQVRDRAEARSLENELRHEIGPDHGLRTRVAWAVARRRDQDDVLYRLNDGRWAIVHLTWANRPERSPWPTTRYFDSSAAVLDQFSGVGSGEADE